MAEPYARFSKKVFTDLVATVKTLRDKLARYPDMTDTVLKDGVTYAFLNGKLEAIAGPNMDVLADNKVTAATLAYQALQNDSLPNGLEPEMYDEIAEILGEEIFNDMAVKSSQTMELHPTPSIESLIEDAKAQYLLRKAERMAEAEAVEQRDDLSVERAKKG